MGNILAETILRFTEYTSLMRRAYDVFPTSQMVNDFREKVDQAYQSGESLSDLSFAMKTFETLRDNDGSPYFDKQLAAIAQDPQFSAFAEISKSLGTPYDLTPAFGSTPEIASALTEELAGDNATIISGGTTPADATMKAEDMLQNNKVVLNISAQQTVENPEVLCSPDGFVPQSQVTTSLFEQCKQHALERVIQEHPEEAQSVADDFNSHAAADMSNPESFGTVEATPNSAATLVVEADFKQEQEGVVDFYFDAIKKMMSGEGQDLGGDGGISLDGNGDLDLGFSQ